MVLRVFLTGGSGTLGKELRRQSGDFKVEFIAPSSKDCDVRDYGSVLKNIQPFDGDVVLHSAALTNTKQIELDASDAIEVNVIGTLNVLKACKELDKKMIFISTDYVFDGSVGDYGPNDLINPLSKYAKTKASAELLVRTYDNSLVIRTSFYGHEFPYPIAFYDQWSSKDYVDVIAPKVLEEIQKNKTGISHVHSRKRTIYEIAKLKSPDVKAMSYEEFDFNLPRDTSLRSEK